MKIIVKSEDTDLHFTLPTGLLLNRMTARCVPGMLQKNGLTVTPEQAAAFVKALKKWKKQHKHWNLVEVQCADGTFVEITI